MRLAFPNMYEHKLYQSHLNNLYQQYIIEKRVPTPVAEEIREEILI